MTKVFIDGSAGTTGLRIHERLSRRHDIELITLPENLRKDTSARKDALNSADIVFLCLPDDAAIDAVGFIENPNTSVIDTSTAHRTSPDWVYGFPERKGARESIRTSKRIANPGCHASGFIALAEPLIHAGVISPETALTCFSVTGYSGGGKKMIAEYERDARSPLLDAPRQYGIAQQHKHLKEMTKISGLKTMPVFCPIVAPFYSGMEVTVPLFAEQVTGSIGAKDGVLEKIKDVYREYYSSHSGKIVNFAETADESGFLSANAFAGRDDMQITVAGNDERILLVSRFDNLGKGASGAAIQNMNIIMGVEETTGLILTEDIK